jgi:hypothetical protein
MRRQVRGFDEQRSAERRFGMAAAGNPAKFGHARQVVLRRLSPRSAHIITGVTGPLWTAVLVGPHRGGWGFWRSGTFISEQE